MDDKSGIDLPRQEVHSREEKAAQVHQQHVFIEVLRTEAVARGDKELDATADALQQQYHAADHSRLQEDVYLSSAHRPASPGLGYFRASENLEMLNKLGVNWTAAELKKYLQPGDSDFRAEIYLPDPAIYGPDAKPVVVFKGSNGLVVAQDPSGHTYTRQSSLSDWIENARQAQGLQSDHYERSMELGRRFKNEYPGPFEVSGHSKGGGQALAASAITGMPAYTSKSATLHPETAQRYARRNVMQVYDINQLAHGYFVRGEVLHDGLNLLQGMSGPHQAQISSVVRNLGELSQLPEGRQQLQTFLKQSLPYDPGMQEAAQGLLAELARHANRDTLRKLPLHAGPDRVVELAPRCRDADGQLIDRPYAPSLRVAAAANLPAIYALDHITTLAVTGKRGGEAVAAGGRWMELGAGVLGENSRNGWEISGRVAGAGTRHAGQIMATNVRYQGEVVAGARLASGHVEAFTERALGAAQKWSNDLTTALIRRAGVDGLADRQDQHSAEYVQKRHAAAERAMSNAKQDAATIEHSVDRAAGGITRATSVVSGQIESQARQIGDGTAEALRSAGTAVRRGGQDAPLLGASLGVAAGSSASVLIATPLTAGALLGKIAADEAATRHGMKDVVQPSMDARTSELERAALRQLQQLRNQEVERDAPAPAGQKSSLLVDDPRHPAFPLYQGAERGVHAEDARVGRSPDIHSSQIAGSLAAEMRLAGGSSVDHVAMSQDAHTVFGVQGRLDDPAHVRVSVDTVTAMNTPLSQSTERVAMADAQRSQAIPLELQQEQLRTTGPRLA